MVVYTRSGFGRLVTAHKEVVTARSLLDWTAFAWSMTEIGTPGALVGSHCG